MALAKSHGVERILAKLRCSIDEGRYYEAHQMYRTLYFRYTSQRQYVEIIDMLYEGSLLLLHHNQQTSGADLATLVVDVLNKSGTPVSEDILEKLAKLHSLIDFESPERIAFLTSALKWSMKSNPEYKSGHPKLHELVALTLWKEKSYQQAWYHFLHSMDGNGCASMLVEYHVTQGFPGEVDLFIAQAVLQFLCLQNKNTATVVFFSYTSQHPDISGNQSNVQSGPPFFMPLLNFLWFLLLSIDSGKLTTFTVLCEHYQPSLKRDPMYSEYLDKIGQLFFGLPPPQRKQQSFFGNLLQSFLGGLDEDDDASSGESFQHTMQQISLQSEELD